MKTSSNDAGTFKPYNPGEITGPTSPGLPYIPPPPESGCGTLGMIIMVVVIVVVSIYTAGAASGAAGTVGGAAGGTGAAAGGAAAGTGAAAGGAAAGGAAAAGSTSVWGAGIAAFSGGGTVMGEGTAIASAAAGAFVGSVAGQAVGSAMGVASFSWRNAAVAGASAAATAGFGALAQGGQLGTTMQTTNWARAAGQAAVGNLTSYSASRATGMDASFSWRSVAASAVSAAVSTGLGQAMGLKPTTDAGGTGSFWKDMGNGVLSGVTNVHTRRAFGFDDAIHYGNIAADAFGNAIGNALVRGMNRGWSGLSEVARAAGAHEQAGWNDTASGTFPAAGDGDVSDNSIVIHNDGLLPTAGTQARSQTDGIVTLDTVRVTAVPDRYSASGWYFYGWNNYSQQWADVQRTTIDVAGWSRPPATPVAYDYDAVGSFMSELQGNMDRMPKPLWQQSASERFSSLNSAQMTMRVDSSIDPVTGRAWPQMQAFDPENPGPMSLQTQNRMRRAQQIENNHLLDERVGNVLAFFGPRYDNGTVAGQFVNPITGERVSNSQREAAIGDIFSVATLRGGVGGVSRNVANSTVASEATTYAQFSRNYASGKYRSLDLSINERGLLAQERLQAQAAGWKRADGSTWWPPYDGAIPGTQRIVTLEPFAPGLPPNFIDRYGGTGGYFVSPAGVPLDARALASTPTGLPNVYSINAAIPGVERGTIAPWFGQRGTGVQYRLPDRVQYYLDMKSLGEVK